MKALCKVSSSLKGLNQLIHLALGITEYHRKLRIVKIQKTAHNLYLIFRLYFIIILGHLGNGQFLFDDPDRYGIILELPGNIRNGLRHGC